MSDDRCPEHPTPPDNPIPPEESLYRRVCWADVEGDHVLATAIDLPSWSFNRAKYSVPEDVLDLVNRSAYNGVAEITVGAIPAEFTPLEKTYHLWAEHVPCLQNYAHSEVRVKREEDEAFQAGLKFGTQTKMALRVTLSNLLRVVRPPREI